MPRTDLCPAVGVTWPLRTSRELGALPSAVPCARLHARQVLWEWGLDALADPIELIVSELVTNALQASAGLTGSRYAGQWTPGLPPVRLWLQSEYSRVLIEVWDGGPELPVRQDTEPDAESGRGLMLIEHLSTDWGSYRPADSTGKVVWASVDADESVADSLGGSAAPRRGFQ